MSADERSEEKSKPRNTRWNDEGLDQPEGNSPDVAANVSTAKTSLVSALRRQYASEDG